MNINNVRPSEGDVMRLNPVHDQSSRRCHAANWRVLHLVARCVAVLLFFSAGVEAQEDFASVSRPEWVPGDKWEYRIQNALTGKDGVTTLIVTARDDNGMTTVEQVDGAGNRTTTRRDRDLNFLQRGAMRYEPCQPLFSFPMAVGKSWDSSFQSINGDNARPVEHEQKAHIAAIEDVDVPAGHFRTFRVEVSDWMRPDVTDFPAGAAYAWRTTVVYWYAPSVQANVKVEVRSVTQSGAALGGYTLTLATYKLASSVTPH